MAPCRPHPSAPFTRVPIRPLTPHQPTGISKFAGGMLGAAFSPTKMLAYGLMATSVVNIAFGGQRRGWAAQGGPAPKAGACSHPHALRGLADHLATPRGAKITSLASIPRLNTHVFPLAPSCAHACRRLSHALTGSCRPIQRLTPSRPPVLGSPPHGRPRFWQQRGLLVGPVGHQRRAAGHRRPRLRHATHALVRGQGARQ